ncbi:TauD/TfdA family dioxygenase [Aspergillus clavatus NRRL 1]|uniref:Taurine catabolism dioxygenase TauD, TfdA family protein n=1 Tax=Aspergillus clavatus (strain ATCC 1007 / CBS 513.65 / DSM 816 / NCTC 3887 / NRRL 1 / QM 1276 / 107) TaxID=344612 RepID=A1CLJ0_ASPCL|nr:taurine catabolism dioxygenase TauD, TfdA family protein [Aspergillus clavatus NRRL 1]EAW10014.1 taurine catabolism dioxygenase TauD, TfdA family protein [Aspergillus clavatus NRRL 1]
MTKLYEKQSFKAPAAGFTFESFDLPSTNQRILGPPHPPDTVSPLALRPSTGIETDITLDDVVETVNSLQAQNGTLTAALARHGTLLFRGLPIHNATDFSRFAHAFGYRPHEIIGIVVDRPVLAPNVAPASEAPKDVLIYNHNESPQVPHAPEYIFFYGHRVPARGGESPISSSLELFHRAQLEIPELIQQLADKGILSRVVYKKEPAYVGGSSLRQAFGKEVQEGDDEATQRRKMEAQIARYGRGKFTTWEWTEDGLVVTHRLPAIRTQPRTNLPSLFTGLAAYYKNMTVNNHGGRRNLTQQLYGDGTPIPEEHLAQLVQITDDIRVLHKWEQGDILVFDNVIAQHGREPWEGDQKDRVVMASLWDGESVPGAYGYGEWAQVVQALDPVESSV